MNYYSHHIGDFRSATSHMDRLERALYREMLDIYYDNEAGLPLDKDIIYRKTAARSVEDKAMVDQILAEFFTQEVDGYHNKRADKEIAIYHAKADISRENGKRGGRPRKEIGVLDNPEETQQVISGNPDLTQRKADHKLTKNQEPRTRERGATAMRLPEDWLPDDALIAFCRQERNDLDPIEVAEKFRDYWLGVPGAKGCKASWPATFRNWVRNEKTQAPRRPAGISRTVCL